MTTTDGVNLAGKRVLVTGAAGPGIGSASARLFAARGAEVLVSDRSERRARAVAAEITASGGKAEPHVMDLGDEASVDTGMAAAMASGGVDVLVNNGALSLPGPFADVTVARWRAVVDVCLTGTFLVTRACLHGMVERSGGTIVNIASIEAFTGSATGNAAYAAAKAGVLGLTRSLAAEYGPHGIRINAVAPGLVPNPGIEAAFGQEYIDNHVRRTPMGRAALPDEVARAVLFLAGPDSSFITGDVLTVSGGLYFHA